MHVNSRAHELVFMLTRPQRRHPNSGEVQPVSGSGMCDKNNILPKERFTNFCRVALTAKRKRIMFPDLITEAIYVFILSENALIHPAAAAFLSGSINVKDF